MCEEVIIEHSLKSLKRAWNLQCCHSNKISDRLNQVLPGLTGFSLGLDDMEGDLSPPIWGGTSTGGQSSNRGGRMGRDIYFMGGPILRIVFNPKR